MPTLMDEPAYVAVVFDEMRPVVCSACFKHLPSGLKRCLGCKTLYYCGATCQKQDWAEHKAECKSLASQEQSVPHLFLMIARIARKIAAGDFGTSYNGRSIKSLADHLNDLMKDPERAQAMEEMAKYLSVLMGSQAPEMTTAMSIYGKICNNSLVITTPDMPLKIGAGIFLGISAYEHSCDPDLNVIFQGKKAYILSDNPKAVLNSKMTVCRLNMFPLSADRRKQLKELYFIDCKCRYCTDVTREQWGKSAFAPCCPKGVALKAKDSNTYKCVVCGKKSPVTMEKAQEAMNALNDYLNNQNSDKGLVSRIEECQEMFHQYCEILSPYNYWMIDLSDRIVSLAEDIDLEEIPYRNKQVVLKHYSLFSLTAIRHYFHSGRWLLQALLNACAGNLPFERPYTKETLNIFKETRDVCTRLYGPEHHLSKCHELAFDQYSKLLRR